MWILWALAFLFWISFSLWYIVDQFPEFGWIIFFSIIVFLWILIYLFQDGLYKIYYYKNWNPIISILPNRTYEEKISSINFQMSRLYFFSNIKLIFIMNVLIFIYMFFYRKMDLMSVFYAGVLYTGVSIIMNAWWRYLSKRKDIIENEYNKKNNS